MKKTMNEITIETIYSEEYGNCIDLIQPIPFQHEDAIISITVDQIDIIIQWLTEAKHELFNPEDNNAKG